MSKWEELTQLDFVGEKTAKKLYENGFVSKRDVCEASSNVLVHLVGPNGAKIAKNNLVVELEPEKKSFGEKASEKIHSGIDRFKTFFGRGNKRIGIYGPTNSGKTTLANRIALDWTGETVGKVSSIPHETKEVKRKGDIEIESGEEKLRINLFDTPGFTTETKREEMEEGEVEEEEIKRREEAVMEGSIQATKHLENIDVVAMVLDSTLDPKKQSNLALFGSLRAKEVPYLVVANKIDSPEAEPERLEEELQERRVVRISAREGEGMESFYKEMVNLAAHGG